MAKMVNESSTMTVQARFYNASNSLATPNSARYLIRDITNDRVVRNWTSVTPASTINIEVTAEDNEIFSSQRRPKRFERRVMTVQANAGEDTQYTDEIEYWIRNLGGIDSQD